MYFIKVISSFLIIIFFLTSCVDETRQNKLSYHFDDLKIRIAEIEIDSSYIDDYLFILQEEASASIRLEDGVLCIFPMHEKIKPTKIRLLEIYADEASYQSHLKTPHFLHYKSMTQKMVKSLELIDMESIDPKSIPTIFRKFK